MNIYLETALIETVIWDSFKYFLWCVFTFMP